MNSGNKKAQQYRNKNHLGAQTSVNTDMLEQLGQLVVPMSMKVFELEKRLESLSRQLQDTKATAKIAEYKAQALQNLSEHSSKTVRAEIVKLQKKDFQIQSDADDRIKGLTNSDGPATLGQVAIVSGKVSKDGIELEDEEIIGSKPEIGKDELFRGIDEAIVGMNVNETKLVTFTVNDKEYQFNFQLLGLRNKPAEAAEGNENEETEVKQ